MKKIIIKAMIFCSLFFCLGVDASTCTYSEQAALNKEVANIKVTYEEKTGLVDPSLYSCQPDGDNDDDSCTSEYDYFQISILNMSDNFYVEVTNNRDNTKKTFTYADVKDGVITFDYEGIMNITTFTFKVYASSMTNCARENYRTIYLTTPRKNLYYYYLQCEQSPDYYLCQKYVTFEDIDFYEFVEKMDNYQEENEPVIPNQNEESFAQRILQFIKDNKVIILISLGVIVVIGGTTAVVVSRKRKKRVL